MQLFTLAAAAASLALPLAGATPVRRDDTICPYPIFTLELTTDLDIWYNGLTLVESGRSTYVSTTPPSGDDDYARFFRNDTVHLFATGFNVDYMYEHETPPYQMITLDEGFNIFDNDPTAVEQYDPCVTGNYSVDGEYLTFTAADGGIGGWWICAGPDDTVGGVSMGTINFNSTYSSDCQELKMKIVPQQTLPADVC